MCIYYHFGFYSGRAYHSLYDQKYALADMNGPSGCVWIIPGTWKN